MRRRENTGRVMLCTIEMKTECDLSAKMIEALQKEKVGRLFWDLPSLLAGDVLNGSLLLRRSCFGGTFARTVSVWF